MIAVLRVAAALALLLSGYAFWRIVRTWWRRWHFRYAILDVFIELGKRGHDLEKVAVEADWVALDLHRLPIGAKIRRLSPELRARVRYVAAEVQEAGDALVRSGWLRPLDATFTIGGKTRRMTPPARVWRLTPMGQDWVQGRVSRSLRRGGAKG